MELIDKFSAPLAVGLENTSAEIIDEKGNFLGVISDDQDIFTKELVRFDTGQFYFHLARGYLSFEKACLKEGTVFKEFAPFTKKKTAQIKTVAGAEAYSKEGKKITELPFKTKLDFIGSAFLFTAEKYLQTEAGLWIAAKDCWLVGDNAIVEKKSISPSSFLTVIADFGSTIVNERREMVGFLPKKSKNYVLNHVVDCFGEHYWQIGERKYICCRDCFVSQSEMKISYQDAHLLLTENINQNNWQAINGCEAAALLEGFHYQRILCDKNYQEWLDLMPIAADYNPYHGFGGSPYENKKGRFEAIFPSALLKWGKKFGPLRDLSGAKTEELKKAIRRGNPCVVYVTLDFGPGETDNYPWGVTLANNHAVLLDGFTKNLWHVSDPIAGHYWIDDASFRNSYELRLWAVEVLKKEGE